MLRDNLVEYLNSKKGFEQFEDIVTTYAYDELTRDNEDEGEELNEEKECD